MSLNKITRVLAFSSVFALTLPAGARTVRTTTTTSESTYTRSPAASNATAPSPVAVDLSASPAANSHVGTTEARRVPLNWDAFIDVQAKVPSLDETADRGVTLNDGALFLSREFAGATAFVELPIRYPGGNSPNFGFAGWKAQAFVQKNYNSIGFKLGQYETFFGIEANDSINRFFADQGLAKGLGVIPMTHAGGQLVYGAGAFTLRAQIVDPLSGGGMQNVLPEYGIQGRFDGATGTFAALGVEYGPAHGTSIDNLLVEALAGASAGRVNLGAQIDYQQAAGSDKQGVGVEALGTFQYTEAMGLGVRFDYYNNVHYTKSIYSLQTSAPVLLDSGLAVAFGPSYKIENDLTLRADVTYLSLDAATISNQSNVWLSLSLVARL